MKKVILSLVTMLFLMSFTTKTEVVSKKVELSPECFSVADTAVDAYQATIGNWIIIGDEYLHAYWEKAYDVCESNTSFDEFQFPYFPPPHQK